MNKIIQFVLCLLAISSTVYASMTPSQMNKFINKTERNLKLQKTIQRIEKGEVNVRKLQIIHLILKNTSEYFVHNLNGVTGNQVFVHKDGHSEAVFDKDRKLVKDGINDGSYNYFDAKKEPLKHFTFDMNPWIMWGSSKKDTTSKHERIFAYVSDIEGGLTKALRDKKRLDAHRNNWEQNGQVQALAIFILALEKADSNSLFTLFDKDITSITQKEVITALKELEDGLIQLY